MYPFNVSGPIHQEEQDNINTPNTYPGCPSGPIRSYDIPSMFPLPRVHHLEKISLFHLEKINLLSIGETTTVLPPPLPARVLCKVCGGKRIIAHTA